MNYATYVETRKAANYYQISEPKNMVKEDMEKEIAMLKEDLKKVKAEKDEMEKSLKIEIKELRHENISFWRNNGIENVLFFISINTNISLY
jgi:hypothetical protein